MSVSRYLIENHGPNETNIKLAFVEAHRLCKSKGLKSIALMFKNKRQFEMSDIAKILGEKAKKDLHKGALVNLEGIQLSLVTTNSLSSHHSYEFVLSAYLPAKDMSKIDGITSVNSILYLPWTADEGKLWQETWKPSVIGVSTWEDTSVPLPTAVQDANLAHTKRINMSTGLSHPSDKQSAIEMIKELQVKVLEFSSEQIPQFALRNGLYPSYSDELAGLVKD